MRQSQNATFILDKSENFFILQDKKKCDCIMMKFKKYHYPSKYENKTQLSSIYTYGLFYSN